MLNLGGLLAVLGLGQAMFQTYVLLDNGYWSGFTIRQMLAELNIRIGYLPLPELERVIDWLLDREFSFSLIVLGTTLMLGTTLARVFDAYQAQCAMKEMQRTHARSPFGDPLATHH